MSERLHKAEKKASLGDIPPYPLAPRPRSRSTRPKSLKSPFIDRRERRRRKSVGGCAGQGTGTSAFAAICMLILDGTGPVIDTEPPPTEVSLPGESDDEVRE